MLRINISEKTFPRLMLCQTLTRKEKNLYKKNDRKRTNWRHVTTCRKWIGATEIYTILTYCGVEAELIDFHKPSGEQGTHPQLVNWVNTYYTEGSAKPPLYLQHQVCNRIFNSTVKVLPKRLYLKVCRANFFPLKNLNRIKQ